MDFDRLVNNHYFKKKKNNNNKKRIAHGITFKFRISIPMLAQFVKSQSSFFLEYRRSLLVFWLVIYFNISKIIFYRTMLNINSISWRLKRWRRTRNTIVF